MFNRLIDKIADMPRESLFLAVVTVVAGGLLTAMYQVCNAQVLHAQERERTMEVQRLAVYDCMDANPRATYRTCVNRVAENFRDQPKAGGSGANPNVMQAGFTRGGGTPATTLSAMAPVGYYGVLGR